MSSGKTDGSNKGALHYTKTTLDALPRGEAGQVFETNEKGRALLPEGVSSKMLYKDVARIAWPSFIELILTQLTSMADQMMVGQMSGTMGVTALSAVGLSSQPKFILMSMITSLNVGSTALVARFRGRNDRQKANDVFKQSVFINLIIAIILTIIGSVFAEPLIRFIAGGGISEETLAYGVQYFKIQMYGFIPLCITFTCTAVLRGIGESKMPMIYNIVANVVNVIFNYLLIYGKFGFPALGVAGASIATVIGQTVAFAIALVIVLSKKRYIYFDFKEKFQFDKDILHDVLTIGFPSMVEQLFMRTGVLIFTRTVTGLGDQAYATHIVCMNIQSLSMMIGQAFASSATTLVGQSLGKRRFDMAELYMKYARTICQVFAVFTGVLIFFFGENLVWLYNKTPEIVEMGGDILMLMAFIQPLQSSQFVTAGGLRGAGDTKFTAKVTLITVVFVRAVFAVVMVNVLHWGLWGAWIAMASDQLLRTTLVIYRYNTGKWKTIRLRNNDDIPQEA